MRTINVDLVVTEQGRGFVELPPDIQPGEHKATLTLVPEQEPTTLQKQAEFLVLDLGPWPENLSLRREDMYDDWGR